MCVFLPSFHWQCTKRSVSVSRASLLASAAPSMPAVSCVRGRRVAQLTFPGVWFLFKTRLSFLSEFLWLIPPVLFVCFLFVEYFLLFYSFKVHIFALLFAHLSEISCFLSFFPSSFHRCTEQTPQSNERSWTILLPTMKKQKQNLSINE